MYRGTEEIIRGVVTVAKEGSSLYLEQRITIVLLEPLSAVLLPKVVEKVRPEER